MSVAFRIKRTDNVATLLGGVEAGSQVRVRCEGEESTLLCREAIAEGHKIAVCEIAAGCGVLKYGTAIGTATADISPGDWVHLHNCRSNVDTRSSSLDVHSGASTDVGYE